MIFQHQPTFDSVPRLLIIVMNAFASSWDMQSRPSNGRTTLSKCSALTTSQKSKLPAGGSDLQLCREQESFNVLPFLSKTDKLGHDCQRDDAKWQELMSSQPTEPQIVTTLLLNKQSATFNAIESKFGRSARTSYRLVGAFSPVDSEH